MISTSKCLHSADQQTGPHEALVGPHVFAECKSPRRAAAFAAAPDSLVPRVVSKYLEVVEGAG